MIPQLTKPKGADPYYIRKPKGYSPCAPGNPKKQDPILDTLPNCVGYSTGRFNSVGGYGKIKYAPRGDAKDFLKDAIRLGLKTSYKPTLGGIMVWGGGPSKLGHVANVEIDHKDGSYTTSESEYWGAVFATYRRSGQDFRNGCKWMSSSYYYLGCINHPDIEEEEEMTDEKFAEFMNRWLEGQKVKPADPYAVDALKWAKEEGIMVGDGTGNQMPQSFVKRQDLAVILKSVK